MALLLGKTLLLVLTLTRRHGCLQVTGTIPVFRHTLAIFRAISTVLLMDAANDYLSVLRTSRGGLQRDASVFFTGMACL